jgi:hypothetical protein
MPKLKKKSYAQRKHADKQRKQADPAQKIVQQVNEQLYFHF